MVASIALNAVHDGHINGEQLFTDDVGILGKYVYRVNGTDFVYSMSAKFSPFIQINFRARAKRIRRMIEHIFAILRDACHHRRPA